MGKIYQIESKLRDLCSDLTNNSVEIYNLLLELSRRIIKRNLSHIGSDVNLDTLPHEISSEIIMRLYSGKLVDLNKWSGYIKKILPRMIKDNARENSPEIIDPLKRKISETSVIEMSSSGSLSILNDKRVDDVLREIESIPKVVEQWCKYHMRNIDLTEEGISNFIISIKLSIIKGKTILYHLPKGLENSVIVYCNKLKLFIAKEILNDQSESPIDIVRRISNIESLESLCGGEEDD